ncbi:uncharacterized protein LOC113147153 [Cyclospora cayetanensis]|uniref:Uncharacterized protein LOC113147153 n=1 Tax=Cyclospora cayetanensis TaxID=88456 RepID=A0A6P6RX58_9EIME|nr:uncharacterized protein LOC113147153 [Cyclospora cayetanensis]
MDAAYQQGDFPRAAPFRKQQQQQQQQQQQKRRDRSGQKPPEDGASASYLGGSRSSKDSEGGRSQLSFPFLNPAAQPQQSVPQEDDASSLDVLGADEAAAASAAALKGTLKEGTLMLGIVAEIHTSELLLQLPYGRMGCVPRSHTLEPQQQQPYAQDQRQQKQHQQKQHQQKQHQQKQHQQKQHQQKQQPETAYEQQLLQRFFVSQMLPCVITGVPSSSSGSSCGAYELSLRPSLCNAGLSLDVLQRGMILAATVASVEEHGVLLCLGVRCKGGSGSPPAAAVRAFLPREQHLLLQQRDNAVLLPGSLVAVALQEVNVAAKTVICAAPLALSSLSASLSAAEERGGGEGTGGAAVAASPLFAPVDLQQPLAWESASPGLLAECRVTRVLMPSSAAKRKKASGEGSALKCMTLAAEDLPLVEGFELRCFASMRAVVLHPHIAHAGMLREQQRQQELLQLRSSLGSTKRKSKATSGREERLRGGSGDEGSSGSLPPGDDSNTDNDSEQQKQQQLDEWLLRLCNKQQPRVYGRIVAVLPQQRTVFVSLLPHIVGWEQQQLLRLLPVHLVLPGTRVKASLPLLRSCSGSGSCSGGSSSGCRALLPLHKLQQQLLLRKDGLTGSGEQEEATAAAAWGADSGRESSARFAVVRIPPSLDAAAGGGSRSKRKREQQQGQQQLIRRCRVLFVHWLDFEIIAAAAEPLLSESLLSPLDAHPGEVLVGTVLKAVKALHEQTNGKHKQQLQLQRVEQQKSGLLIR